MENKDRWNKLLKDLGLIEKGYKFIVVIGNSSANCIKKVADNGDFVIINNTKFIKIETNRSSIKFNGQKRFDDMDGMAKVVHKKCNELFEKLANFEREEKEKERLLEEAEKKLKIESDTKLEEMKLLFPDMEISEWIIHSYYGIGFKLDGICVQTEDMLTFDVNQSPPQNINSDNVKLIVRAYNKEQAGVVSMKVYCNCTWCKSNSLNENKNVTEKEIDNAYCDPNHDIYISYSPEDKEIYCESFVDKITEGS